jgi:serine/threonine protein phosphatase PrpC
MHVERFGSTASACSLSRMVAWSRPTVPSFAALPLDLFASCLQDYELEVERGDLLIMGTDGLFDNVFEKEIAEAGLLLRSKGATPQYASQQIAAFAQQRSFLKTGLSPFAVQADASGYKHMGGKPDDITVVVAYVE